MFMNRMGGKYRYLQKVRNPASPKVISISLVNKKPRDLKASNFSDCTENINSGRGGKTLYLCWNTDKGKIFNKLKSDLPYPKSK